MNAVCLASAGLAVPGLHQMLLHPQQGRFVGDLDVKIRVLFSISGHIWRRIAMAAAKKSSLFPPDPYYIPGSSNNTVTCPGYGLNSLGYEGFVPQYGYQFGETFGKTTFRLLTDPNVRKSPRSLLAPVHKLRFIQDFSGTKHEVPDYIPAHPGDLLSSKKATAGASLAEPALELSAPAPRRGPAEERPVPPRVGPGDAAPLHEQSRCVPSHPGLRLAYGYKQRISPQPTATQKASEEKEGRLPDVTAAGGLEKKDGPCQLDGACGPGWRNFSCIPEIKQELKAHPTNIHFNKIECSWLGSGSELSCGVKGGSRFYWCLLYFCFYFEPVKIEGVTLPAVTETVDAESYTRLPKLDVPNAIQQKAISGYTGYIPRYTWITGVNYIQAVKDAMNEFDRNQFLQRNTVCDFGKRLPQTYWPNKRIYTSAGLIPFYTGFVPTLRHSYALTFGNSTRKAYQKEQRRQACALRKKL
ncbi:ciliary microtubule inner protein 2A [Struthio camelus]|uniref:ciliary microtubule inner protein 2A n=1 Tax=Struthio camelus TaxID=8801 RepID=UPI0036041FA0